MKIDAPEALSADVQRLREHLARCGDGGGRSTWGDMGLASIEVTVAACANGGAAELCGALSWI